jgi:hypothetical protein
MKYEISFAATDFTIKIEAESFAEAESITNRNYPEFTIKHIAILQEQSIAIYLLRGENNFHAEIHPCNYTEVIINGEPMYLRYSIENGCPLEAMDTAKCYGSEMLLNTIPCDLKE